MHKDKNGIYLAIAQWPSSEVWENSGRNLPKIEAEVCRTQMKDNCFSIETIYELEVEVDLTKDALFG